MMSLKRRPSAPGQVVKASYTILLAAQTISPAAMLAVRCQTSFREKRTMSLASTISVLEMVRMACIHLGRLASALEKSCICSGTSCRQSLAIST